MRDDRAEDRHANGAADVPPELDLARRDAEVFARQRALGRVDVQRHGHAQTDADHDEAAHDVGLRCADVHLREAVQAEHHDDQADRADEPVARDADHELAGHDAGADEADHHRSREQA